MSSERVLRFHLAGERYAFRVLDVGGVTACAGVRRVAGTPPSVLGIAEWRGALLTVLDLPRLLGHESPPEAACLVRLAPPLHETAFYVPTTVRLTEADPPTKLLRPSELLSRVEAERA